MKKLISFILCMCLLLSACGIAQTEMPSLRLSAAMNPVSKSILDDGGVRYVFEGIDEDIYYAFSDYLVECGCALEDYAVNGDVLSAVISKDGAIFAFRYDYAKKQAAVTYPEGTIEQRINVEEAKRLASLVGEYITMGKYQQLGFGKAQPVEWLVLEAKNGRLFVISRYALDAKPYNTERKNITWEESTLRAWLNDEFLNTVFSADEQAMIAETLVANDRSQCLADCYDFYNTVGGNDTLDKIFLMSYGEAHKYFGVTQDDYNMAPRAKATAYALSQGASEHYGNLTAEGDRATNWTLRSPGWSQDSALGVYSGGSLTANFVEWDGEGIRPAFWIEYDMTLADDCDMDADVMLGEAEPEPEPEPEVEEVVTVGKVRVQGGTNVRSAADSGSDKAGYIEKDGVYGYVRLENGWYLIVLEDGTQGYVFNSRCTETR